jgi:hypothetical protein
MLINGSLLRDNICYQTIEFETYKRDQFNFETSYKKFQRVNCNDLLTTTNTIAL